MMDLRRWCIKVGGNLVGFGRSRVHIDGKPYLDRWILYVGSGTIRLHKFWRGDDDRAPHDHPWNFWTFPLTSYHERTKDGFRFVKSFRWHRRAASFRHMVLGSDYSVWYEAGGHDPLLKSGFTTPKPFYTIVVTGNRIRGWGFWPAIDEVRTTGTIRRAFVPWREWK